MRRWEPWPKLLQSRGKCVSDAFTRRAPALVDTPRDAVTAAALAATDEEDFWRRLGWRD